MNWHPLSTRDKVAVDLLVGDHANILSLQFPVVWPADPRIQSHQLGHRGLPRSPDVQDYMCNSGFAEVRLSARGLNDRRIHPHLDGATTPARVW